MNAAQREGARAFLNEIGTPHDAPARLMLERMARVLDRLEAAWREEQRDERLTQAERQSLGAAE